MIQTRAKTRFDAPKVLKSARAGSIKSLGHAGAAIRLAARHSIRKSPKASAAGTPPHTRKGRIRNAIKYAVIAAAQRPDLIAGIVLIGPFVRNPGTNPLLPLAFRLLLARPWGPAAMRAFYRRSYPGRPPADPTGT